MPGLEGYDSPVPKTYSAAHAGKIILSPAQKVWRGIGIVAGGLVALMVGLGVFTVANLFFTYNDSEVFVDVFPDDDLRPEAGPTGAVTFLLLGSDSRGGIDESLDSAEGDRSDTMMLARISADRQNVTLMSIMRDSWVEIPGRGENKINAALALGGVPLTVQTVEDLVGVRIDHVVVIDFEGFKSLTDAVGGVTINNPGKFTPIGTNVPFEAGEITLNGEQALAFVRERKAFASGDYRRVENQQLFLKGLASTLVSKISATNPAASVRMANALLPYMARDAGLTLEVMGSLGWSLRGVDVDTLNTFTMPTTGTGMIRGQSVVLVDFDELAVVTARFNDDTIHRYSPPE